MNNYILKLFEDFKIVKRIQYKLPYLFQLAEIEASRSGKVGMEVGTLREQIIIAMLIYFLGENNVDTNISIQEPEIDVKVCQVPLSIKTISSKGFTGFKLVWTVDRIKSFEFYDKYFPKVDILLVHVNWGGKGGLYYFPYETQQRIFRQYGREEYIKLPKEGTNPRGIEITKKAVIELVNDNDSRKIEIFWSKKDIVYNPYFRWIELWKED